MSYEEALQYTLRLLSVRDYLEKTLRYKLKQRGTSDQTIDAVVERLKELSYINDQEFIKGFIRGRAVKREGPYKIVQKLIQRGCSRSDIETHLSIYTQSQQYENLVSIIEAKQHITHQKLIQYCRHRGYRYDLIIEVMNDLGI